MKRFNPPEDSTNNSDWISQVENYANGSGNNIQNHEYPIIDTFKKSFIIAIGTFATISFLKVVAPNFFDDKKCDGSTTMQVSSSDTYQDVVAKAEGVVTEKDGGTKPPQYLVASYIGTLNSDYIWDYEKYGGRPVVIAKGINTVVIPVRCNG